MLTMDIETETDDSADVVTLSTLHGSKGLEFDAVFLVGCEEGYLPHARTLDARATDGVPSTTGEAAADIEEERRLFYVGVTRAKEQLVLSRARSRVLRGKAVARTPSRFLLDVPPELLEEADRERRGPDDRPRSRGRRRGHPRDAAKAASLSGLRPLRLSSRMRLCGSPRRVTRERLLDVGDDVGRVLDADREADEAVGDADGLRAARSSSRSSS